MAAAAPSPLASSVEKTNGAKLSRLLIDGGTTVLRNVFDTCHSPANLAADLNANYLTLKNLLKKRVLCAAQWDQLFPPGGATPDSKTFDITLLFLLLTNICGLSPPLSGWHAKPPPSDTSREANLARIKFFRNKLYGHVSTTGVDSTTFSSLWQEISTVLVALGVDQAQIDRLKAEHPGEEEYLKILCNWAKSEEDIKSQLKEVQQSVNTVLSKMKRVQREVLKVRQDLDSKKDSRAEELLNTLAKSEFKGDIEFHAERFQEGTREWIFKIVNDWLDDRTSPHRVMVISGNAGMGKSVVSAVVCKRMQEAGRLSGSHFCQHNNVRYRNPQLMLQSLASHLSRALPEYKKALLEQLSRNLGTEINNMGVEELFALLFKEPLSTISDPGRNILMVIDALDESEYKGRNELLDVIASHFCKLPLWIRFLMTTRPEVNIANSLKGLQPVQLDSNCDENKDDIRLFFEKRLSQVMPNKDRDVLLNKLAEKSEGVILCAYFIVDFIEKNAPLLTQKFLDSSLPLGISSVYQSYFKRLEKEFRQELDLDEDKFLSFLSAVTAAKEPLPVGFISNMFGFRTISCHRKVNKAISCISTLLPVRDGRLHIFHKSVKDWLTDVSRYGQHTFTVDQKEGSQVLSKLCETEFDVMKRNGIHSTQFSDTEKYALHYGVRHMLEMMAGQMNAHKLKELVENYVTDLELMFAKQCLGDTAGSNDILTLTKQEYFEFLPTSVQQAVTTALSVMRRHKHVLRRQPQHFFQAILNEGGHDFASKVSQILHNRYPEISYIEVLTKVDNSAKGKVQARFECDSLVACFDVSPQSEYMVCECINRSIQLWSLQTGDRLWSREALTVKPYGSPSLKEPCALRDTENFFHPEENRERNSSLSFYRSVVFHPNGKSVLPGSLKNVFTITGDLIDLFPASNCRFTMCAFSGDKTKMLTDCPDNPEHAVMWNMSDGSEIARFQRKENLSSFAFSPDGKMVAISDCSQHTGFYKVDNLNCESLCETAIPMWICGLLHFYPDGQGIVWGYLEQDWQGPIHFTDSEVPCPSSQLQVAIRNPDYEERNTSWWPWELKSLEEKRFLFQDEDYRHATGFFSVISKESLLFGSPFSSEVSMMYPEKFKDDDEEEEFPGMYEPSGYLYDVALSFNGKYCYVTEVHSGGPRIVFVDEDSESDDDNSLVTITVYNEEKILHRCSKDFSYAFCLLPVREGVLIFTDNDKLALWDFELSKCFRTFSEVDCTRMLFLVSDDLVGSLGHCLENGFQKVNILSISSAEIVFTTSVQGNVTCISCSDKFQFVACSREEVWSSDNLVIVEVAVWNNSQHLWKRSVVIDNDEYYIEPHAWLSRNSDLVVTWESLDQGFGVHILNASTGATIHKLLTDQKIIDCTFLSEGNHFVCSSGDEVVRMYNVNSGELISLVDMETYPYCLAASFDEPLFAVALEDIEYRLFRVHLPEVQEREEERKRLTVQ